MGIPAVPLFAPSLLKTRVPAPAYESTLKIVASGVGALDGNAAWAFVQAYLHDQAQQPIGSTLSRSDAEKLLRRRVFELAQRIARDPRILIDIDTLLALAAQFGLNNSSRVTALFGAAFDTHPILARELHETAIPALTTAIAPPERLSSSRTASKDHEDRIARVSAILPLIARSHSIVARELGSDVHFMSAMAAAYDFCSHTCAGMVDALDSLLSLDGQQDASKLFASLFAMLDKPGLLQDYSRLTGFSDRLEEAFGSGKDADPRLGYVLATLRSGGDRPLPTFLTAAPAAPAQSTIIASRAATPATNGKGKGKITEPQPDLSDPRIDQLAEMFSDHDRLFLWKCINHPTFAGDLDAIVSALLEGNAPPDLLADDVNSPPSPPPTNFIPERRNIFDDDDMDFSKLRIGKPEGTADGLLQTATRDPGFAEQMKADILRRVQEMELEDAEEEDRDRVGDDDDVSVDGVVRVRDGDDDTEGEPGLDEAAKRQKEVEFLVEEEYIRDKSVFERDAATRRSKARQDLRERTNWADEQIEGWAIMLERNPQKDKILAKHEFKGNRPPANDESDDDEDEDSSEDGEVAAAGPSSHGDGRGRGRGGRGRGGGRGGRGGTSGGDGSARDRAHKNANKNSSHRRGRDKKLSRLGQPQG